MLAASQGSSDWSNVLELTSMTLRVSLNSFEFFYQPYPNPYKFCSSLEPIFFIFPNDFRPSIQNVKLKKINEEILKVI